MTGTKIWCQPPPLPRPPLLLRHHHHQLRHLPHLLRAFNSTSTTSSTSTSVLKIQSFFSCTNWRRRSLFFALPLSAAIFLSPKLNLTAAADAIDDPSFDPVTASEKASSAALSRRVSEAIRLLDLARDLQAKGDFLQALDYFTLVVRDYKDFAFSEYARVGRALVLYEIGDRDEAIAEMEDVSISLKGYPEIHAALAAAFYVDKHAPLLAENQFTIATLLDPHYTDLSYVRETKHWPPSLLPMAGLTDLFLLTLLAIVLDHLHSDATSD